MSRTNSSTTLDRTRRSMNGRRYFAEAARRLHIDRLDPDEIAELPPLDVKRGPAESKLGGRIARDLTLLSPEETAARRRSSEELLSESPSDAPASFDKQ